MSNCAERAQDIFKLFALTALLGFCFFCQAAEAAPRTSPARVLVLPFQVHMDTQQQETLENDFPQQLGRRIGQNGPQVVPHSEMMRLLQSRKVSTLDIATVRSLAAAAGATHAVYGSVNQAGGAVSIDARLVSASASQQPQPMFVEGSGASGLDRAAATLAGAIAHELPTPTVTPAGHTPVAGASAGGNVIAGVEVQGTKHLDPDVVLMRLSTRKGDTVNAAIIDDELKSIWNLGYFSDVRADIQQRPEGPVLVYTVTEKPKVETIDVEGASEIDAEDILSAMSTKTGSILNESLLADDIQKILELYRKKGFYLARVDQRIDQRRTGAGLMLTISEGKKLYIRDVSLEGISQLDESDVKKELLLRERSIISWITGTGVLKEELIERDSSAIIAYYLDRGFMDITVAAPKIDYTEDGINITFPIHEGQRYTLGGVTFSGDLIDSEDKLRSLIESDKLAADGEYFKLSAMQQDTKAITDFYADYGYAFADIDPQPRKKQDGSPVVDINFSIQKKSKIYIRRVLVEGNNKTRDNVILREMRLTDGEQFEGKKLRRSSERLHKLGFFDMAEAELIPTENEDEVDLKIKVKERPTGALMAGVGYSTFSSVGVSGTIMERNLWGKGYSLALQAAFSGRRDAYTLTFNNPRLNDTPLSVGFETYHWRDDFIDYDKKTTGGVVRFSYPIGEYTSIGWGYRLEQYKMYNLNHDAASIIRKYATGDRYTSVGLARIVRDSTDRDRPTSGNIDSLSVEYGGGVLGGDDDFFTVSAEHQTYYQLRPDHVLHARIKGSAIFNNGSDEVPVFERFWMGGMQSVRGYDSRDIVPRDPESGDRIGGDRMAFANLEYIWSLDNELGLNLVPFFDIGFNLDTDSNWNWSDEIKRSAGLELRWRSPMGDLRFSYGFPLDEDRKGSREKAGRFEFSMGQFF